MALFRKQKTDPFSDRARALNAEIAALQAKIEKLDAQVTAQGQPKIRPATVPQRAVPAATSSAPAQSSLPEPVFEMVDQNKLKARAESAHAPEHVNDLGVRKFDLHSFIQRLKHHFNPPPTSNPKLVSYLAAGSFQGMRPLRYEKRIARNRFIFLVTILFLALLGILLVFLRNN